MERDPGSARRGRRDMAWDKLDAGWLSGTGGLGCGRPVQTARLNSLRPLCGVRPAKCPSQGRSGGLAGALT